MGWLGHLDLNYSLGEGGRTIALDRHDGPLRVLQRLYPEGPGICHHVLVHPPGGIVGGDVLNINLHQASGTHALVTTPSATRYYRSAGELAAQRLQARLETGARLEWLPLETIAYNACIAENTQVFDLAPGAQMIGWDMLALGLPTAGQPFERGELTQHLEIPGLWLERGRLAASDTALLNSPLGLAGHKVMGTLWLASGSPLPAAQRQTLLDATRETLTAHALGPTAGVTSPDPRLIVCRALAPRIEPLFALWRSLRGLWRQEVWGLEAQPPRIWSQ